MKITANTQATFSLPVVLLEPMITIIGKSQKNPIMANNNNVLIPESSILYRFRIYLSGYKSYKASLLIISLMILSKYNGVTKLSFILLSLANIHSEWLF